jgi:methionyl-tRNA formyltransferase
MKILFLFNNDCAKALLKSIEELGHEVIPYGERLTVDFIKAGKFDLAVSYTYRYILTDELIAALKGNVVNIHNAYLPYNRGADPNLWSLVEGTPRGVTLHYISPGLDKGDIIAQRLVTEGDGESLKSSYDNLDKNAREMFLEAFKDYDKWNELRRAPRGSGTYHSLKDGEKIKSVITSYDMKISDFLEALKA